MIKNTLILIAAVLLVWLNVRHLDSTPEVILVDDRDYLGDGYEVWIGDDQVGRIYLDSIGYTITDGEDSLKYLTAEEVQYFLTFESLPR